MSQALALLERIRRSPYATLAVRDGVEIVLGPDDDALRVRSPEGQLGVYAASPDPRVDGTIACSAADRARMAAGEAPRDGVTLRPGTRDIAPRKRQAHLVLMAAALGWDGPWPDPAAAPEHRAILREALADLAIGPRDGGFQVGGFDVRQTSTAAGETLLLDAGRHALRLDLPARADRERALRRMAQVAPLLAGGAPAAVGFGAATWNLTPDPAFPRGWTMPDALGAVWAIRETAPADRTRG